jgi:hypothetical protein
MASMSGPCRAPIVLVTAGRRVLILDVDGTRLMVAAGGPWIAARGSRRAAQVRVHPDRAKLLRSGATRSVSSSSHAAMRPSATSVVFPDTSTTWMEPESEYAILVPSGDITGVSIDEIAPRASGRRPFEITRWDPEKLSGPSAEGRR